MPESTTQIPAPLSHLLGFNAGYVDTAGFLALKGLFTAHVTGNFVTLGAALVQGSSGAVSKMSALPVFCIVVLLARWASNHLIASHHAPMRYLIGVKVLLLAAAAALLIAFGPFANSDALDVFAAGMLLVAAMAVQNAMQRMHLGQMPPSTLMTGSTTQVMIDLSDILGRAHPETRAAAVARLQKLIPAIATFALGCAVAALAYVAGGMWCFVLPPLVALATVRYTQR